MPYAQLKRELGSIHAIAERRPEGTVELDMFATLPGMSPHHKAWIVGAYAPEDVFQAGWELRGEWRTFGQLLDEVVISWTNLQLAAF